MTRSAPSEVGGILLTGGASSRMGLDKATILVRGVPMAKRLASVLRDVADPVVEVGPGVTSLDAVLESPPRSGPLVATAAGAQHLRVQGFEGAALVVACDLASMTAAVLRAIATWPDARSVVPVADGRPQPLCARWSAKDLLLAGELVAKGEHTMRALIERADLAFVPATGAELPLAAFVDLDTPADLALFEAREGLVDPPP